MRIALLAGAMIALAPSAPIAAQADMTMEDGRPAAARTRADVEMRVRRQFERMDANRDGYLSADEQAVRGDRRGTREGGRRAATFDRLDANRDGVLDRGEFTAGQGAGRGGRGLARMDADGDGNISLAEMTAARMRRFDRMDVDRDGTLSADEREKRRARRDGRDS